MKVLIIGGNRFVGLRVSHALDARPDIELHIINRTGQVAHTKNAVIYKGDRNRLETAHLDRDWDLVIDLACYKQNEAESALTFFKNVKRYMNISSGSVYGEGLDLKETAWSPLEFNLNQPADPTSYQDGKRRCEAVFHQQTRFPVLSVRFPFILGPDDYTHRLDFHIGRAERGEEVYIPNLNARISYIQSEDAAKFIVWAISQPQLTGPLNVAAPDDLSMKGLIAQIEMLTGDKVRLAKTEREGNHSPYGAEIGFSLNTDRLKAAGFKARPISEWLPALIAPQAPPHKGIVH